MVYHFLPKEIEEQQVKIELIEEYRHHKTIIKYPKPDPQKRAVDEYDYGYDDIQSE